MSEASPKNLASGLEELGAQEAGMPPQSCSPWCGRQEDDLELIVPASRNIYCSNVWGYMKTGGRLEGHSDPEAIDVAQTSGSGGR